MAESTADLSTISQERAGEAVSEVIHAQMRPLDWMLGRWRGCGEGRFPGIDEFDYSEDITFTSVGQPSFTYHALSRTPDGSRPMHMESGYLRVNTANENATECAFVLAHNFGLTTLEEGFWDPENQQLVLEFKDLTRMTYSKDEKVTGSQRIYRRLGEDKMEYVFMMETKNKPLQEHLRIVYRKVC